MPTHCYLPRYTTLCQLHCELVVFTDLGGRGILGPQMMKEVGSIKQKDTTKIYRQVIPLYAIPLASRSDQGQF